MKEILRRNTLRPGNTSLQSIIDEVNVTQGGAAPATPDKKEGPPSEEAKT